MIIPSFTNIIILSHSIIRMEKNSPPFVEKKKNIMSTDCRLNHPPITNHVASRCPASLMEFRWNEHWNASYPIGITTGANHLISAFQLPGLVI